MYMYLATISGIEIWDTYSKKINLKATVQNSLVNPFPLFFLWNLPVEVKHFPSDSHHLSLSLVHNAAFHEDELVFTCAENWCITVEHNIVGKVTLRRR